MIGLLIVAHGNLGDSLIQCATYVLGQRPARLEAIDIMAYGSPEAMQAAVDARIRALDEGEGVIVLTDLYGATPSNTVCRLIHPGRVEVVSGVNLPMLLKVLNYRSESLPALLQRAEQGGQEGIFSVDACHCDA